MEYDHKKIEKKWQEAWAQAKLYQTADSVNGKENFYLLVEFPYPSGNLHVGHWYSFAVPDILTRKLRMEGKNVLYPIGFDAFGLPAENAAIKNKVNPRDWTESNMAYMRDQLRSMGASFDWSREVVTCHPDYYRWTQWLFLQLFKAGLAYRKETMVNWCPNDKTVLANEQVIDGKCERCGHEVIQREMLQWNIKITEYADRLHDDLEALDWPEPIKESQRNWIGRSEGAEIDFPLDLGQKLKFVILHGFQSAPDRPRWLWAKEKLEEMGHEVVLPTLPNPDHPTEDEWVAAALSATQYDDRTVLVGHSLGAVAALKVLEKLQSPIARLVTVGGFVNKNFKDNPRPFEKTFTWKFDGEKIRSNVRSITILHDPRDNAVSDAQAQELSDLLRTPITLGTSNEPHFTGDTEPDVVMWLRPTIRVFTTRPDTLYSGTFLVLAPEHPWVIAALEHKTVLANNDEVAAYVDLSRKKTELARLADDKDKTGVQLLGVHALNPATGQPMPLWVADFVIGSYGTGAVFADSHDKRDFEFAKKYGIPLKTSIRPKGGSDDTKIRNLETCFEGKGILYDSGEFSGLTSEEAIPRITEKFGRRKTTFKLRDWIVSRQRYWGVPIPVIHCPKCGSVAVPDDQLPVLLPQTDDYLPDGAGKSPLAKIDSFVHVPCPQCGGDAERETDTFDTFIDSSWYFLRYADPHNDSTFASREKQDLWMPIDLYSGGAEHTTMHLLYSRFWHKALFDRGLVGDSEPYVRRMNRGIILGPDGQKMSKSKGNVIDPDDVVNRLGADTVRMYLAFIGPYNEVASYPWNPDGVVGVRRFLERLWRAQEWVIAADALDATKYVTIDKALHRAIKKVGEDVRQLKFNTAISQLMILLNAIEKEKQLGKEQWELLLKILAPFAPHITEELWHEQGHDSSIHLEAWPQFDPKLLVDDEVVIAIQIDGKTRDEVIVPAAASKEETERAAREKVAARLEGKSVARAIVVPKRLVNFVLE